jgi:hypothetical protein
MVLSTNPGEKDKYWKKHQVHLRSQGFNHSCDFSEKPVFVEAKVWNGFSSKALIERDK